MGISKTYSKAQPLKIPKNLFCVCRSTSAINLKLRKRLLKNLNAAICLYDSAPLFLYPSKPYLLLDLMVYSILVHFQGHSAALQSLLMMSDNRRAMSGDRARNVHVWLVDSGIVLHSTTGPSASIEVTLNMKFAVSFFYYSLTYSYLGFS